MPTTRTETLSPPTPGPEGSAATATVVAPDEANGHGIVLLQEIFGVGEFILAKAADLAALGYTVICPDVFWRIEQGTSLAHDEAGLERAFGLVQRWGAEVAEEVGREDLAAAVALTRSLPEVTGKVAVMGYCLGGTLAYATASTTAVDACVSYYGSGVADLVTAGLRPSCPTVLHFGGADAYLPDEQVDVIRAALADRSDVEVQVQPGAGHAFENRFAPQFSDPDAAAVSWPITVEFLAATLG